MVATLLSVLSSILGRLMPVFEMHGADAYAGYCMAASAFLALATTLRRGEHIRVTLIINRLSPAAYRWLDVFNTRGFAGVQHASLAFDSLGHAVDAIQRYFYRA